VAEHHVRQLRKRGHIGLTYHVSTSTRRIDVVCTVVSQEWTKLGLTKKFDVMCTLLLAGMEQNTPYPSTSRLLPCRWKAPGHFLTADVLSDPTKRQVYDMYGEEGLKGGVPPSGAGGPEGFRGGYSFSPDMVRIWFVRTGYCSLRNPASRTSKDSVHTSTWLQHTQAKRATSDAASSNAGLQT